MLSKVSEIKPLELSLSHGNLAQTIMIVVSRCDKIGTQWGTTVMKIVVTTICKINYSVKTDSRIDPICLDKWWSKPEWGHLWLPEWGVRIIPILLIQMRTPVFTHFLTGSLLCQQTRSGLWKIRSLLEPLTISIVSFLENLILYTKHLVMLPLHQTVFIVVKAYSKI